MFIIIPPKRGEDRPGSWLASPLIVALLVMMAIGAAFECCTKMRELRFRKEVQERLEQIDFALRQMRH